MLDQLERTVDGIGCEIQITDALDESPKSSGLNPFETDTKTLDCGNRRGFLSVNVAVCLQNP